MFFGLKEQISTASSSCTEEIFASQGTADILTLLASSIAEMYLDSCTQC